MQPLSASQYKEIAEELHTRLTGVCLAIDRIVTGPAHRRVTLGLAVAQVSAYIQSLPRKHCDHATTTERHNSDESLSWCLIKNCECTHTPQSAYHCDRKWARKVD
jgi:hypothetical protein